MFSLVGAALSALALSPQLAIAVEYATVKGANFVVNATGKRLPLIGVAYQPGGSGGVSETYDPLADPKSCLRDAILLQQLGVNAIRVYNLNSALNHDECASIFNAAGIYMILDVNSGAEGQYINRVDPAKTYNKVYLNHVFEVITGFMDYPNVLGFFANNEGLNEQSSHDLPKYLRAVVRDMKDFIAKQAPRQLPVGYSAAQVQEMLVNTWNYLGCELDNSTSSAIDMFGLNSYAWCGEVSIHVAGYDQLANMFASTSIPVFFSELGCNKVTPRKFTEISEGLYTPQMSVLSGGFVYEFTQEPNNYGLVERHTTGDVTLRQDYTNLLAQYKKLDINSLTKINETAMGIKPPKCSPGLIGTKGAQPFYATWDIPARPDGVDDLILKGLKDFTNKGKIVTVKEKAMPVSVTDANGAKLEGLTLGVIGNITPQDSGGKTGASNTSPSSGPHSSSAAAGLAPLSGIEARTVVALAAVLVSFVGGLALL